MKIIICFCVALLQSIIHCSPSSCDSKKSNASEQLEEAFAKNNGAINGIFWPSKNGSLGCGSFGVMYKGTLKYPKTKKMPIAMKFTPIEDKKVAKKEYKIYSYLKAIEEPQVELYGIPSVYYYGFWDDYVMMGITLLDSGLQNAREFDHLNELDLLIVCKDFVMALKYIHSCGIHHGDIRFENLMFRRNNGFIIDFNGAKKMYNQTILDSTSREIGLQYAINDWKRFLQTISDFCGVDILLHYDPDEKPETEREIDIILETLEAAERMCEEIKRVSLEMAKYIFGRVDEKKAYDRMYAVIEGEIQDFTLKPPAVVHWLAKEVDKVREEYAMTPVVNISSIIDPLTLNEINYPDVDWDHFKNKISGSSLSGRIRKASTWDMNERKRR